MCASFLLIVVISASAMAAGADAQEKFEFNIPQQRADYSLTQFAEQADLTLIFRFHGVKDKTANELKGRYSVTEAIDVLLAGSGLQPLYSDQGQLMSVADTTADESSASEGEEMNVNKKGLGALLASIFVASGAGAQDVAADSEAVALEEIIVTAEKRAESILEIPIAISAYSGDTLGMAGVTGIENLNQLAPSLQFGQSSTDTFVAIRGVGAELVNIGAETGVTISQDGIPFTVQYLFDTDFFDIERVEVLRGPQGTINGRNSTGGAVNIHSRRPAEEFEGGFKATIGNFDRFGVEGYISGPISTDALLGRLAVRADRADGWLKNTFRGEKLNELDTVQAKASILTELTENLLAYITFDGMVDRGVEAVSLDLGRARPDQPGFAELQGVSSLNADSLEFEADFQTTTRIESYKSAIELFWDFSNSVTLTSRTGHVSYNRSGSADFDGTRVAAVLFSSAETDLWQVSQELTLTADLNDRLDMILGAIYLRSKGNVPISIGLPLLGLPAGSFELAPEQELESYAAYTQWRYELTEAFRISAGVRYTRDEKDYFEEDRIFGGIIAAISGNESWEATTPRLALDYQPNDDLLVFASISRGFKAGGFNTFGSVAGDPNDYDPEFVWNYEAGLKAKLLNKRVRTAVTVFHADYTDLQQSILRTPAGGGVPVQSVENAGDSRITGVELELDAYVTDEFQLAVSGTWLDAEYDSLLTVDTVFPELGEQDLAGNKLARAPEMQFSVSGEYTISLGRQKNASLRLDYMWQDDTFFTFFNHELNGQEAFGLLNLSAAIESDDARWRFSIFARNLLDERYRVGGRIQDVGGGNQLTGHVGAPRVYGASLALKF